MIMSSPSLSDEPGAASAAVVGQARAMLDDWVPHTEQWPSTADFLREIEDGVTAKHDPATTPGPRAVVAGS